MWLHGCLPLSHRFQRSAESCEAWSKISQSWISDSGIRLTPQYPTILPFYRDEHIAITARSNLSCTLNTEDQYYTAQVLFEINWILFSLFTQSVSGCHFLRWNLYARLLIFIWVQNISLLRETQLTSVGSIYSKTSIFTTYEDKPTVRYYTAGSMWCYIALHPQFMS